MTSAQTIINQYHDIAGDTRGIGGYYDYSLALDAKQLIVSLNTVYGEFPKTYWKFEEDHMSCTFASNQDPLVAYINKTAKFSDKKGQELSKAGDIEWLIVSDSDVGEIADTGSEDISLKGICLYLFTINGSKTAMVGDRDTIPFLYLFLKNGGGQILLRELRGMLFAFLENIGEGGEKEKALALCRKARRLLQGIQDCAYSPEEYYEEFSSRIYYYINKKSGQDRTNCKIDCQKLLEELWQTHIKLPDGIMVKKEVGIADEDSTSSNVAVGRNLLLLLKSLDIICLHYDLNESLLLKGAEENLLPSRRHTLSVLKTFLDSHYPNHNGSTHSLEKVKECYSAQLS